ncbi:MAG: hypothetical protein Q9207_005516 [Kuettlingeria erythrocarpa]
MASAPSASDSHLDSILLELSWTLFAVTTVVLGLRFYSDIVIVRSFRLHSWIAMLAFHQQAIALASQVLVACAVQAGIGKHIDSLEPRQKLRAMTYIWQAQPLQLLANTAGKVAIAALLVTLHGPKFAKCKTIFIWTLAGLQSVFTVLAISMIYAQCRPVAKLWRDTLHGSCDGRTRNRDVGYVQGGISSFVDLALATYPMILFWDLHVKLVKKVVLITLFAFGIVYDDERFYQRNHTDDQYQQIGADAGHDTTEMYLVLLAGSLPGLRPLFNKRLRTFSQRKADYGYAPRPDRQGRLHNKSHVVLKLSSLPAGRAKAYASASDRIDNGSTENILATMGHGDIMKTTEVNVRSGRNSGQGQISCPKGDHCRNTDWADLEMAKTSL